jgi:hypothetical protein
MVMAFVSKGIKILNVKATYPPLAHVFLLGAL